MLTVTAEATREEMRDARLPLAYRDSCAHLLIPLNKCRRETWYAPWKCTVRFLNMGVEARGARRGERL
jgi:NADH dehydrogenase (ubiquinone) 1 beta subcomplex subunit 7